MRGDSETARKKRPWVAFALMFIPVALVTWLPHEAALSNLLGRHLKQIGKVAGKAKVTAHTAVKEPSRFDAIWRPITYTSEKKAVRVTAFS